MNDGSVDPRVNERQAWILVGGLFAVLTVSLGLGFYNLSLYMNVLAEARAFPLTDLSAATAVFFLAGGAAGLVVGQFLQRGDARQIIVAGAVLGGGAIALIGQIGAGVVEHAADHRCQRSHGNHEEKGARLALGHGQAPAVEQLQAAAVGWVFDPQRA